MSTVGQPAAIGFGPPASVTISPCRAARAPRGLPVYQYCRAPGPRAQGRPMACQISYSRCRLSHVFTSVDLHDPTLNGRRATAIDIYCVTFQVELRALGLDGAAADRDVPSLEVNALSFERQLAVALDPDVLIRLYDDLLVTRYGDRVHDVR